MSAHDEADIRDRLRDTLAAVPVDSPPAAAIARRGARIRWRRRAGVVAGLVALVAAGAALPAAVPVLTAPVLSPPGQVTVSPPPAGAPPGLIASGSTDGRAWQATLYGNVQSPRIRIPGVTAPTVGETFGDPVDFQSAVGGSRVALVGDVRSDVTRVTVWLAGGLVLHLVPVRFGPSRWVAVVLPVRLRVRNILAYGRPGEVGHSVPYGQHTPNDDDVISWLAPGQTGAVPVTVRVPVLVVGAQRRSVLSGPVFIHLGPWGRCQSGGYIHAGKLCDRGPSVVFHQAPVGQNDCNFTTSIESCVATTELRVSLVRLRLSNGTVWRIRPTTVGPARYFAFVLRGTHVIRWTALDRSGHQIATGASWFW